MGKKIIVINEGSLNRQDDNAVYTIDAAKKHLAETIIDDSSDAYDATYVKNAPFFIKEETDKGVDIKRVQGLPFMIECPTALAATVDTIIFNTGNMMGGLSTASNADGSGYDLQQNELKSFSNIVYSNFGLNANAVLNDMFKTIDFGISKSLENHKFEQSRYSFDGEDNLSMERLSWKYKFLADLTSYISNPKAEEDTLIISSKLICGYATLIVSDVNLIVLDKLRTIKNITSDKVSEYMEAFINKMGDEIQDYILAGLYNIALMATTSEQILSKAKAPALPASKFSNILSIER